MICAVAFLSPAFLQESAGQELSARELFYLPVRPPAVTPVRPAVRSDSRKAKTEAYEVAGSAHQAAVASGLAHQGGWPTGGALPAVVGPPLGLRYTVVKLEKDGPREVRPDMPFHAGDRIQVNIEPNLDGYLYVVARGSSGKWKPVFPSAGLDQSDNSVEGLITYTLPSKGLAFTFDERPGIEQLFIVLSRQPEPNFEKTIYLVRSGAERPLSNSDRLKSQPMEAAKQLPAVAGGKIDDGMVDNLRKLYARDLIVGEVRPAASEERKETAIYVVNPKPSVDSRVIADVRLTHE